MKTRRRGTKINFIQFFIILFLLLISPIYIGGSIFGFSYAKDKGIPDINIPPGPEISKIEVSKNTFPASTDCRNPSAGAGSCANPIYDTFKLTYTVGDNIIFEKFSQLRISQAYKYNGKYRTEPKYTKVYSWPIIQGRNPTEPNYATVKVTNNSFGPVLVQLIQEKSNNRARLRFSNKIGPGAIIEITYGDTTFGSPGQLIPPLAYSIDFIIEQDSDNDGIYEIVNSDMPTLETVGTVLDGFKITAPSTPDKNKFDVIVKAMQGEDTPFGNMYIVKEYSGTIKFSSTDPDADLPDDYTFKLEDEGIKKFSINLPNNGIHTLSVEEITSNKSGISNPIVIEETSSNKKTKKKFEEKQLSDSSDNNKNLYWGVLQQHTNIGGHGAQTPQFAFDYGKNVAGLDFLSLTEHCSTDFNWTYSSQVADSFYEPGEYVTYGASEWSSRLFGHRHVVHLDALKGNAYCAHDTKNPTVPYVPLLDDIFDAYDGKDVLLIIHHTAWKYSVAGRGPTDDVVFGDINNKNQKLFEIFSHHGSSEKYDNSPYEIHGNKDKIHQWGSDKEVYFQDAISLGYKFGVTSGTDSHMGVPGANIGIGDVNVSSPDVIYSRAGLTAAYSKDLTKEGIWEALNSRRTYGTTGARIILNFDINDHVMGEEFSSWVEPKIKARVIGTDIIDKIELIKNGKNTIQAYNPGKKVFSFTYIDDDVSQGEENSYYLKVIQRDNHMAWSSPIWVDMKVDGAGNRKTKISESL